MVTLKWTALDHIIESLRDVSGLENLHAEKFEISHKGFKRSYCLTSKIKLASIDETTSQNPILIYIVSSDQVQSKMQIKAA